VAGRKWPGCVPAFPLIIAFLSCLNKRYAQAGAQQPGGSFLPAAPLRPPAAHHLPAGLRMPHK